MGVLEAFPQLEPSKILYFLPILLLTYYVTTVIRQYFRLRHIPGPFLNSLTPLCLAYHSLKGDVTEYVYKTAKEYGPLARIAPNTVVYTDPDTFRKICSYKAGYNKGLWFEFSRWDLNSYSCLAMRDSATRKERKNKLAPAVSCHSTVYQCYSLRLMNTVYG